MSFIFVLLQEIITGKGVVQGIQDGDPFSMGCAVATVVSILGLTAFLALKGSDDYVDHELGRK